MQLFYIPNISGTEVVLDETESKHAVRVLRLTVGTEVQLIDGKGGFYEAEIVEANPKNCRLKINKTIHGFGKKNFRLHMAVAPTKNIDRFEWFLEKATEIGIDEITPLLTEHSERKAIKLERLEKILISAMKQSVKAYLPKLNEIASFHEFIENCTTQNRFIAHCYNGEKQHLKNVVTKENDTVILIGPEGDFSPEEVTLAKQKGFTEISLGTARLRTETAAIVACHIVNLVNE
ncbi:MAG: 16S rRNA (uracil(1498)-N(3))-methyltransferase [Prolixibacteraceae bacterium]|nr:16S rRNA (uracil(1498)-N(3))-methyltransferase [Prolixibacteraceae bacterium]